MRLSQLQVAELLAALGARTPAPASGAAAALTGALGAALVELAARFASDQESATSANALAARLAELADEDGDAYSAYMAERRNAARSDAARARTIAVPLEVADCADRVAALGAHVRAQLASAVAADAEAGEALARAAAGVARRLAEFNQAP
jgi:formiminotetrahydrofolate cyclodeaminase